ncbi:MAG: hypothetical protein JSS02_31920 [Planctomycetes bacterium]|nr:hypothetical protein [Planctomycetota bacterium]
MKAFFVTLGAIVAGIVVAMLLLVAVEFYSTLVHPLPEGFGNTQEEMCQHVENYPGWVLATVVPLWGLIAYACTWTARRLGNRISALITGNLFLLAIAANLAMLPYPTWFRIAMLVMAPLAVVMAGKLIVPKPGPTISAGQSPKR